VPITFVGGYLGAGKTTAINELLAHADRPIAVIVNDVGAINIDAALIRRRHGDTIELTNGCVCCSAIEGLGGAFDQIRAREVPPDHVVVEMSGVAKPEVMVHWGRSAGFMLDGLVVVVAADQLAEGALPGWVRKHVEAHITAADLLILTKTDIVSGLSASGARAVLGQLAPGVPVLVPDRTAAGATALGRFLALGGRRPVDAPPVRDSTLFDAHAVELVTPPAGMTLADLDRWLAQLPDRTDGLLVRAKGIVETIDAGLVIVQVVGRRIEITGLPAAEKQPATDLVVISLRH
jgi:G3E family GTPase